MSRKESNIRFSSLNQQKQFPDFRPRPTKSKLPPSLFPDKTSPIEIHDHAPVNGISLFFTLADNHWFNDVSFVRFKSYLKALNHRKRKQKLMYTTPQSCTPHLSDGNGRQKGNALLHLHGPEQVNYSNPHAIGTVRPLPVQNKRSLVKLYNNTQYVPQPSFAEKKR